MTPAEKNVVKSLIAVAWADGKIESAESEVIDGMLTAFDANEAEAKELRAYASSKRALSDIPVKDLRGEDRELLLSNASVLMHADGDAAEAEEKILRDLATLLGFSQADRERIVESGKDGALHLKSSSLAPDAPVAPSMRKS